MQRRIKNQSKNIKNLGKGGPLEIFSEETILQSKGPNKLSYYVNRIIIWFAFFNRGTDLYELIRKFHISPFMVGPSGWSIVHILCSEDHYSTLKFFMDHEYSYINSYREFNIHYVMKISTSDYLNTPLHLAAIYNNEDIFRLIYDEYHIDGIFNLNIHCL